MCGARYQLVETQLLSRSYTPRILQCGAQEIRKMLRSQYLYLLPLRLRNPAHTLIFPAAKRDRVRIGARESNQRERTTVSNSFI
jgi:hypothetical protein